MNIDLAVVLCLADEKKNQPFDDYCASVVARMLEKSSEEKAFLQQYDIHYYIADNSKDDSVARVVDADDNCDFEDGRNFAVVFNRDVLARLETEDSMAFVVAHELSHIMYRKGFLDFERLAYGEEACCDCNAIRLMDAGGYNLLDIAAVDALYPCLSEEMEARLRERRAFIQRNDILMTSGLGKSRPLQKDTFIHLQKEPWKRENIFEHGEPDVARVIEEIVDIAERGDRDSFKRGLRDFLSQRSTEESTKLVMNILGQVIPKFPPVTEMIATCRHRQKIYNHPVVMMSDIVMEQFNRSGKKLLPPADVQIVAKYMQENRLYFEQRDRRLWEPLRKTMAAATLLGSHNIGGRK